MNWLRSGGTGQRALGRKRMLWTRAPLHPIDRGLGRGGQSRVVGAWQCQQVGPASWWHCWSNYKTQVSGKKWLPGWENSGAQSSLLKIPASSCVEAAAVAQ